ncbi:Uncharacterised protein [Corynebacterium kutscheri]|uniref:Uncharacterized protein n=1 Tax=Corynebacterium kutscheri TaxID=35755 RepID=A0A0F6QYT5_9CORY|nr:hypothetical protein [Corynebacterium kutscheri]AKE40340.1 hypothetical protein UL82_00515 [Corynebacterium kutscheri]VEH05400.1 Uncharacterised protein [Corynebacterium kutscheri]VEH10734.1 Uncharacterised protein [Corynebacterium kutscheri]VEH80786.1 Uncharacterised protein [Corynebacterium kutscheri]
MAGSTFAIAPAHAARTPQEFGREVQLNFSKYWNEGVQECVGEYGEEQRSLCEYYTAVDLNYLIHLQEGFNPARAEYFKKLADEASYKLYVSKYGDDNSIPFD